jgi:hypothetical protein
MKRACTEMDSGDMDELTLFAALFAIREPGIEDVMCRNILANGCRTRYKLIAYNP